jgi:outer membrane lipoprotein carrier protein
MSPRCSQQEDALIIRNTLRRGLLFIGLIVIALAAPQFADGAESNLTLEQVLDGIESRYTNKSFKAEFIQETTLKAMDIVDFASGEVLMRYPGMMRWVYQKPERQVIVTDGHKLWIYRPADNQVMTGSAPAFFRDGKGASFLSDIKLIRKKFKISLKASNDDFFYQILLKPLGKTLDVTDIQLSVTKSTFTVIRILTYNSYGDENRIELLNHQFDVKLEDSLFSFQTPPGADVLQLDE